MVFCRCRWNRNRDVPILMTLAIFAGVFGALYREAVPRLWAVALGAGAIVVLWHGGRVLFTGGGR